MFMYYVSLCIFNTLYYYIIYYSIYFYNLI